MNESRAIQRLTALWAFIEVGLGGILHALKIPLTGFLVGAGAVIVLSLMAGMNKKKAHQHILPALIVVLLIKSTVTPHSGIGAYIAVGFQGLLAMVLFRISPHWLGSILLGIIAMVESAGQKLFMLVLIYGQSVIDGVNALAGQVAKMFHFDWNRGALTLVLIYLAAYGLWGGVVGWYGYQFSKRMKKIDPQNKYAVEISRTGLNESSSKRKRKKYSILILFGLLAALMIWLTSSGNTDTAIYLLIRVVLVLLFFYKLLGPLLSRLLHKILTKRKSRYLEEMQEVLDFLPYMQILTKRAWYETKGIEMPFRIIRFFEDLVFLAIYFEKDRNDIHTNG